jgi:hypothetical protein
MNQLREEERKKKTNFIPEKGPPFIRLEIVVN